MLHQVSIEQFYYRGQYFETVDVSSYSLVLVLRHHDPCVYYSSRCSFRLFSCIAHLDMAIHDGERKRVEGIMDRVPSTQDGFGMRYSKPSLPGLVHAFSVHCYCLVLSPRIFHLFFPS